MDQFSEKNKNDEYVWYDIGEDWFSFNEEMLEWEMKYLQITCKDHLGKDSKKRENTLFLWFGHEPSWSRYMGCLVGRSVSTQRSCPVISAAHPIKFWAPKMAKLVLNCSVDLQWVREDALNLKNFILVFVRVLK